MMTSWSSRFESIRFYAGDGTTLSSRGMELPIFQSEPEWSDPAKYIADPGLRDAVNVALLLGAPLLVTGDPGTGKTQLAGSIAHELQLPPPLTFCAKTTSLANDLFYRYDALADFHDAHFNKDSASKDTYISYEALGLAILLALEAGESQAYLPASLQGKGPTRSVVLIDEIDKAPRDFPNDLLNEIERMSFYVRETGRTFQAVDSRRPIVVLTSNSEKNLPDAFLRRCVFYNIKYPGKERLRGIVEGRISGKYQLSSEALEHALEHFDEIRKLAAVHPPSTAECLAWLQVLSVMEIDPANLRPGQAELLALSYCALAKNKEDLDRMRKPLSKGTAGR
jgi:MoxR-like ATPase